MDIQTVTALIDTQGPDITGRVVDMPAGSTHYVSGKDARDFYSHHPDTFTVGSEYDTVLDQHAAEHQELFSNAPESATYTDVTTDDATLTAIDRTVFAATIVDTFLYDTSKDSDGGAWRHRCGHTSWENETLSGNWLGSAANETAARAISGATTGSYYYDTTAAGFYTLNAGSGKTATYRGNVRKFPAQVLITVEAARVVLWDLTQAACPMFMVFSGASYCHVWDGALTACAALNGQICVTGANGVTRLHFINERQERHSSIHLMRTVQKFSSRNDTSITTYTTGSIATIAATHNDVAMTVLPNAPVDVATGLPVPTIAVATNGGVSVIKDDGNVWDITGFSTDGDAVRVAFMPNPLNGLWVTGSYNGGDQGLLYQFNTLPTADVASSTATKIYLNSGFPAISSAYNYYLAPGKNGYLANGGNQYLDIFRPNYGTPASGMKAQVSLTWNTGWQVGDIRGAWLADTVAETVTGTELVTNGTFATDTTGWTTGNSATFVQSGGAAVLTNGAASNGYAYQAITTVVGKSYTVRGDLTLGTATGPRLTAGTTTQGAELGVAQLAASGVFNLTFIATGTTTYITAFTNSVTSGHTATYDNISCRLADVDRSVKAKGLQAFGSLTKSAVASGAALMGYSGFSAANYLEQPYNSDLDFGTGDFCIMGWAVGAIDGYILDRAVVGTGMARFSLYPNGANIGFVTVDNAGNSTNYVFTSSVINTATTKFLSFIRRSTGSAEMYADGVLLQTVAGTVRNVSDSTLAATLKVGVRYDATSPTTTAKFALLRMTATAPTAEQIKHIYETERPLFEANAQCCLAGTSNAVTALAYDEETDLLHVGTSYGRSAFKGLVRVSSEATPVGAITALAAGAGVIAQAGATAVDVYVPAYSLREELLRDAEQAAKFGQVLVAHDFTATASQEVFTLPVGWEIVAVYQQGTLKRETTAWVRTFDGFRWSVDLVTGATVSDWISILAKRV